MKRLLFAVLLLLVLPAVSAAPVASGSSGCQAVSNTAGIITAGNACLAFVASGDLSRSETEQGGIGGTISVPALSGGTVLVGTLTTENAVGCASLTTDADVSSSAIGGWIDFDVTANIAAGFGSCSFIIQLEAVADPTIGANVKVAGWRLMVEFRADQPLVDLADDEQADGWLTLAPGFLEIFGPFLLVFGLAWVTARPTSPVWIVPASLVAGLGVLLMAFMQPFAFLVFLQAIAGSFLAVFSTAMMSVRRLEMKPRRRGPF